MTVRIVALIVLSLAVPASAQKTAPPPNPLSGAKSFRCSFPVYSTVRWNGTSAEPIHGTQDFSFQVDSIDYKRGRARIVASGSALATMLLTPTGMNLIEQTPIGNLNLTTIFVGGGQEPTFVSVHSRHLGDLEGSPRSSQNYGTCELIK